MQPNQAAARPGLILTDTNRLGDIAELVVITEALKRGANAYKNVGCTGKTDIIIEHNDKLLQVDVKLEKYHQNGRWCSRGVAVAKFPRVIVNPKSWKCRWVRGKEPMGWESFWS